MIDNKNPQGFDNFDLLESILCVLFQLTEEGNFKLVSDKQQLGTHNQSVGRTIYGGVIRTNIFILFVVIDRPINGSLRQSALVNVCARD